MLTLAISWRGNRDTPPGPKRPQWRPSAQVFTQYIPYLISRWRENRADSVQLWREIQALGSTHSAWTVCRFITPLRRAADVGHAPEPQGLPTPARGGRPPARCHSPWSAPAAKRSREAETYLGQLCQMDAGIGRAHGLSQAFLTMVRGAPGP